MTQGNVLPFRQKEKFYAPDNLRPIKADIFLETLISIEAYKNYQEKPVLKCFCGKYNLQFCKDTYGFFWKSWKTDDYEGTVRFSSNLLLRRGT